MIVTKEILISDLSKATNVSMTKIHRCYDELEKIIFDYLHSTTLDDNTVVKLFNGLSIECKYHQADTVRQPMTGEQIDVPEKIWAKACLTRNYNRKLNKDWQK